MKEMLLDQVDLLKSISKKIDYLSCAVDGSESSLEGLSFILSDISIELGTCSDNVQEYLKTQ